MWVVKRATSPFNSCCSNVANKVARFCCSISFAFVRRFDKRAWIIVSQVSC